MTTDNPQTYANATEYLEQIDSLVNAMAFIRARLSGYPFGSRQWYTLKMAEGKFEDCLISICWQFIIDYPFTQEIHPAVTIVRDAQMRPMQIKIADDLAPWIAPHGPEDHPVTESFENERRQSGLQCNSSIAGPLPSRQRLPLREDGVSSPILLLQEE